MPDKLREEFLMAIKHRNSITSKLNEGIDADDSFNRATNRAEDLARELKVTQIRDDVKHPSAAARKAPK